VHLQARSSALSITIKQRNALHIDNASSSLHMFADLYTRVSLCQMRPSLTLSNSCSLFLSPSPRLSLSLLPSLYLSLSLSHSLSSLACWRSLSLSPSFCLSLSHTHSLSLSLSFSLSLSLSHSLKPAVSSYGMTSHRSNRSVGNRMTRRMTYWQSRDSDS